MRTAASLGDLEFMLLLVILNLGDEAYGVSVSRELTLLRSRAMSLASVYVALEKLELKGLVTSRLGEASPERGGRAKRYFRVTAEGLRSANETRNTLTRLWTILPRTKGDPA